MYAQGRIYIMKVGVRFYSILSILCNYVNINDAKLILIFSELNFKSLIIKILSKIIFFEIILLGNIYIWKKRVHIVDKYSIF